MTLANLRVEMEAVWIGFECQRGKQFVIRPLVGGVNAISGESLSGNMSSLLRQMNSLTSCQDYLVLPEQRWLDGVATSPGVVRQFVATGRTSPRQKEPIMAEKVAKSQGSSSEKTTSGASHDENPQAPTGGSIEWQVTGKDSVGGVQLQIIPKLELSNFFAGSEKDVVPAFSGSSRLVSYTHPVPDTARELVLLKTPSEQGFKAGDLMHVKDLVTRRSARLKTIADIFSESSTALNSQELIELQLTTPAQGQFEVNVKTITGHTVHCSVSSTMTVYQIKLLIENMEGIPKDQQRLIFAGKQLQNGMFREPERQNERRAN